MNRIILFILVFGLWASCAEPPKKQSLTATALDKDTIQTKPIVTKKIIPKIDTLDFDTTEFLELIRLDSSIVLDLKYATTDNFVEEQMYDCGRCFLRPAVAKAVVKAHQRLQEQGLGLKMFDCLRPRPVQWDLWNKVPNPKYVADPRKGSMHNRGAAVDLTIIAADGKELDMGTGFDFFGKEAWTAYTDLPKQTLANRRLLRETLATFDLKHIKTEWWHYSFQGKQYPISDFVWECSERE